MGAVSSLSYRRHERGSELLSNLPKITQLMNSKWQGWQRAHNHYVVAQQGNMCNINGEHLFDLKSLKTITVCPT